MEETDGVRNTKYYRKNGFTRRCETTLLLETPQHKSGSIEHTPKKQNRYEYSVPDHENNISIAHGVVWTPTYAFDTETTTTSK